MHDFASSYVVLRGSKAFLIGLVTFIAIWVGFHVVTGFDNDFGTLNTILSSEASINIALFSVVSDRQAKAQKKQADALANLVTDIRKIASATFTTADAQKSILADNSQTLHRLREIHEAEGRT